MLNFYVSDSPLFYNLATNLLKQSLTFSYQSYYIKHVLPFKETGSRDDFTNFNEMGQICAAAGFIFLEAPLILCKQIEIFP